MIKFIIALCIIPYISHAADQRAHKLYDQVRCPTCIAQSVKESDTIASQQIREFINRRVAKGDSDHTILADLQKYYGSDIIFKPSLTSYTVMLWVLPLGFLLLALYKLFYKTFKKL